MKKLSAMLLALLMMTVGVFALAENAEFIPQLRLEDMEPLGQRWVLHNEEGVRIGYAVSSVDQRIWTYYNPEGDLTSYKMISADTMTNVEYDLTGKIISIYMTTADGASCYYDGAADVWTEWSEEASAYSIVMETAPWVDLEALAPLMTVEPADAE